MRPDTLLRNTVLLIALLFAVACTTVDFDYPKSESYAIRDTSDTDIGRAFAEIVAAHPADQSGFYPVFNGIDSLALRLLLAERAERSIDAQYFLIHNDLVGVAFIDALLRAADRGVRVRLLVDDIQLGGHDAGLAAIDAHENVELRIFNPFKHRKLRALDVTRFSRVTRRMHNKSFTVDNQIALIGGRNIADEYFDANKGERFGDLDVLTIGSIVPKVSAMFDTFWNHPASVPVPAFAEASPDAAEALANLGGLIAERLQDVEASEYADAVKSSVLHYVQSDASAFTWAKYDLVFDSPDKSNPDAAADADSIVVQMREAIGEVENELFVITPYFVLTKDAIAGFRQLRQRGVDMTVLTNSLASNNHSISHSGYAPARRELLEMGIKLYELRANTNIPADESQGVQEAKRTLHAKAFVVDRKRVFIGSFNWNQRSVNLDTELGVIMHAPGLAAEIVDRVIAALPQQAFEVFLDDDGDLRWKGLDNGEPVIVAHEPQTSAWHRFTAGFLRIAPNSQL
ncbi:MAG: phospholipase D family protein [Woeseiaceae bacterium]|nr:phospholipase D family protein [Woeseiaceae bacterium]